jgi:ABC-type lipoprotein release transport system permease subunit
MTGEAAVTMGAAGQGMVAGDLVNTASRLQSAAPAGAVLVVLAVSLVAALLASLAPARAASKRDPLEGLRYE